MDDDTLTVLTVCTGNICRSPMAASVLGARIAAAGLTDRVRVVSAAVSDEEEGNRIDPRAARALAARGYDPLAAHRAHQVDRAGLAAASLVLPMTAQHARALGRLGVTGPVVRMYRSFDPAVAAGERLDRVDPSWDLADPWYGGPADFEVALDQVERGAPGVVAWLADRLAGPLPGASQPTG